MDSGKCPICDASFADESGGLSAHLAAMQKALAPDADDTSDEAEAIRRHEEFATKKQTAAIKREVARRSWSR